MLLRTKKSQHLAGISLAVMGIGFLVTIPLHHSFLVMILQGAFEAGLVGGLADWFAVTALFRHPLGLPIPHTALLPKNRQRITATIISMIENDWLTKESIRQKISGVRFTERLLGIINKELSSKAAKTNLIKAIQHFIRSIDCEKLAPMVAKELKSKLSQVGLQNYIPVIVDQITERKYDEKALDYILNEVQEWAQRDSTKYRLGSMATEAVENIKADGFMQFALKSFRSLINEEKLGTIIQNLIEKGVSSFQDPLNQNRQTLLHHIHDKMERLKTDENLTTELEKWKDQFLLEWKPEEKIIELLRQLQDRAHDFIEEPAFLEGYLLPMLKKAVENLENDREKMMEIENWVQTQISLFIDKNHSKIGMLVRENLEKLDDKTLISMIETNVGKDLQWIRVNGAVCGFLIGLCLTGIRLLF